MYRLEEDSKDKESREKEEVKQEVKKKADKKDALSLIPLVEQSELSPPLKEVLKEWLEYKKEKKENYTEVGFKKTLTIVKKNADIYGTSKIVDLIDLCISNNYQGIIWDKLKDNKSQKNDLSFMKIDL